MIHVTRPFTVGNWIQSPDKQIEGTVVDIGYYMTKVISFEKRPIYIPNSLFSSIILVNPSRMENRRIKETVGIRYDDFNAMDEITTEIKNMLKKHQEIDQEKTILVNFKSYGPSSLDIMIYCFTKTTVWSEWLDAQQNVLIKIGQIINSHKAQIAFPTTTIDMPNTLTQNTPV